MKHLSVAFLWHMHQPFYKDSLKNIYSMPWVRMHAIKGYFDMPSILEDYPAIKATFNLVPSLLLQLQEYSDRKANDLFLEKTIIPAEDLTLEDKKFIIWNFFMANWDNMIKPSRRYWHLLSTRGLGKICDNEWTDIIRRFSVQDMRDIQVWFNLCWFGYRAKQKFPEIKDLIKKDKNFTEEDKHNVIEAQYKVINSIIPLYKRLLQSGQVELTTSPFYHPILPLVYNTDFARRAMPHSELPDKFSYPQDAEAQIQKGINFFKETFGITPQGMWPSEGSVSLELIPLLEKAGIKWIATDEDILMKSIFVTDKGEALFKPYQVQYNDSKINIIFRDRGLSDLIGFTYSKNPPQKSCADLMYHLDNIINHTSIQNPMVNIILDGENAWEYYPDGGEQFFRHLYDNLSKHTYISTVRVSDYIAEHSNTATIYNLHSGSWINHNYGIWIGGNEENQAWNYLRKTRIFVTNYIKNHPELSQDTIEKLMEEIYIAEGSDWFWWYGDTFSSDNDDEFDRLFRLRLSNVYSILNIDIPEYLKEPIINKKEVALQTMPVGFIHPIIDGKNTHFYEWQEAGYFNTFTSGGTMHKSESYISGIYFGFDLNNLYLRFDPLYENIKTSKKDNLFINLIIHHTDKNFLIEFPYKFEKDIKYTLYQLDGDKKNKIKIGVFSTIKADIIIEKSISFQTLGLSPDEAVRFYVKIKHGVLELERYPKSGYISFTVPDEEFESTMWSV